MDRQDLAILWFDYNDVSLAKVEQFLKKFDKIEHIFDTNRVENAFFNEKDLMEIKDKLLYENFDEFENRVDAELAKYNITPVTMLSSNYPQKLKNISDPPLVLYAI